MNKLLERSDENVSLIPLLKERKNTFVPFQMQQNLGKKH